MPSGSCGLVWVSEITKQIQSHMAWTASRCYRNTWEGNLNQSWSLEVAWIRGQSYVSLFINRPWCQVSCKSDLFQIPSRGFSLLIQCLRYAFETCFGKIANTPGQQTRWAKTTEPEWPRDWSTSGEAQDWKPVHSMEYYSAVKKNTFGSDEMDETGADYTEWSKPERKTPIQ